MPVDHLYPVFKEMSISVFYPFLYCFFLLLLLLFNCMSRLCILEINPLLVTLFVNIRPNL